MIRIADQGDAQREDTGCGILYGVLRDSAYKLLKLAEEEKKRHQAKGWWQEHCHHRPDDLGRVNGLKHRNQYENEEE
jgi:hypothetical protein